MIILWHPTKTMPLCCFRSVHEGHRHSGGECRHQLRFSKARRNLPAQDWSIRPVRSHGRGRQPNHVWRQVCGVDRCLANKIFIVTFLEASAGSMEAEIGPCRAAVVQRGSAVIECCTLNWGNPCLNPFAVISRLGQFNSHEIGSVHTSGKMTVEICAL